MCFSRTIGGNYAARTHPQTTMNAWHHIPERHRRQTRQGYQSVQYSDSDTAEYTTINNV
jgi:hypothetical protein